MKQLFEELATSYVAASDSHKNVPQLAFGCEVLSQRVLLGRAIGDMECEHVVGHLYACEKSDRKFVYVKIAYNLQGFISASDPVKITTLSDLGALPYPSSMNIVLLGEHPRLVESIGARDEGTSHWLLEPRWSETKRWIAEHST